MKKTLHKAFLAAGAFALAACALADNVGRVEYVSVDLAKRTATVAWTWTDLADSAVRLSLTRNGDDFPTAGWGGSLFIGDGTTGCAVGGTRSGFNELFFDVGRDNVPTNGRYAVQIIATNEAGRVEEWVRGSLTVRANPAAEGMPASWSAYADIARKVAPLIDCEGLFLNPANADALWGAVSGRAGAMVTNCVEDATAATLQSAKDYADAAIAGAGGLTPEMVTNIVLDVAPAPGDYLAVSNAAMNAAQVSDVINGFTPWVFSDGVHRTFSKFAVDATDTWLSPYRYGYRVDTPSGGAYYAFSVEPEATFLKFAFFDGAPSNPDTWGTDYDFSASRTDLNIARRTESEAALAGKASTNDVQLTPVYGEWTITRDGVDVTAQVPQPVFSQEQGEWWVGSSHISSDMMADGAKSGTENSTHLAWEAFADAFGDHIASYSAVRVAVGYVLGAQADKVLASTNLQTGVSAATVTNIVREASGGIWDSQLEVWWTPRMRNGSLTYEATTNVNLNAGN